MTVDVTGEEGPPPPPPLPPPQALIEPNIANVTPTNSADLRQFRFVGDLNSRRITHASEVTGILSTESPRLAAVVSAAIVKTIEEGPAEVTEGGEKLQEVPVGNPLQEKDTVCWNPFDGVIESVVEACCPALTVSDVGDNAMLKSGGGKLIVYVAEAMPLTEYPGAVAIAWIISVESTLMTDPPAY